MGKLFVKAAGIIAALVLIPVAITMIFSGAPLNTPLGGENKEAKEASGKSEQKDTTYSVDDYIMMAMAANIDLSMNMETLKAQAVIIRTTIYEKLQESTEESLTLDSLGLDTMTLSELQKQVSIEEYSTDVSNLENAIYSTKGEIITYEGKPIKALFHYANAGRTRSYEEAYGEKIPYLVSVESSKDLQAEVGISTKEYTKKEVIGKLKKKYTITEVTEDNLLDFLAIKEKEEEGYVHTVNVGKLEIPGEAFAEIFALNSSNFYFEEKDGCVRIVCRGKGNGLGFSQYGANQMAESGRKYKELLCYYYKGVEISPVS